MLLAELLDVLGRAKFAKRLAAAVPPATPAAVRQRYVALATIVVPEPIERVVPTDADDDAVIATALAAGAELIVTGAAPRERRLDTEGQTRHRRYPQPHREGLADHK